MTATRTGATNTALLGSGGRTLARALGALAIALAIVVVAIVPPASQDPNDIYTSPWHYVRDIGLLAFLLGTITAAEIARRRGIAANTPARLVQAGYALIAVGVVAGLALREDPGWFFVLAGPGLAASAVGYVWWAITAHRHKALPTWAAVLLAVGGVTAIAGSEFGTSVLIGSFWLYLSSRNTGPATAATTTRYA